MTTLTAPVAAPAFSPPRPGRDRAWLAMLAGLPAVALAAALGPAPAATAAGGAVLLVVAICTYTDLRWRKIYNWASYPAFLWAVALSLAGATVVPERWQARLGAPDPAGCLFGALIGFVGLVIAYHLSGGGAGDVKLATALGAWLGVQGAVHLLVYTYAVGGVVLLVWNVWRHGPVLIFGGLLRRLGAALFPRLVAPPTAEQAVTLRQGVPMSPFFAAGALLVLLGVVPS